MKTLIKIAVFFMLTSASAISTQPLLLSLHDGKEAQPGVGCAELVGFCDIPPMLAISGE